VMELLTAESNAITDHPTETEPILAEPTVLSHTVVMVLSIPTTVNGAMLESTTTTSTESALPLASLTLAVPLFHLLEEPSTSVTSGPPFDHQSLSTSDHGLNLHVLRVLLATF